MAGPYLEHDLRCRNQARIALHPVATGSGAAPTGLPMKKLLSLTVLISSLLTLALGCRSTGSAMKEDTAPATREDQLVASHIEAIGGLEALKAIEGLKWTGESEGMGFQMDYTMVQKRPSMMRTDVLSDMGSFRSGYDGQTAWADNPMAGTGPEAVTGSRAYSMIDQAAIGGVLVGYKDRGNALAYVEEVALKGKPAHKLRLSRADGSETMLYLDAETSLLVQTEADMENPQMGGTMKVVTTYSDFRPVNGVTLPFKMSSDIGGQFSWTVNYTEVEVNPEIDDAMFALPK